MSRLSVYVSLLLTVAILMVTASDIPSKNEASPLGSETVQIATDVVEQTDETRAITPYEYEAVMLQNVPGRKLACWRCNVPCNAYACCNNGYPQCCIRNGYCRCCQR